METGSFMQRLKKYVPVTIPLIDSMLRRAQRIAIALELKAFSSANKNRTFYKHHEFCGRDILFVFFGVLAIVLSIVLNLYHWGKVEIFL